MRRLLVIGAVAVAQLALVGVAVAPQLSARVTGESYLLRVAPLDPIDPFRGAYVSLDYPDVRNTTSSGVGGGLGSMEDGRPSGAVYVTLVRDGDVWVADAFLRDRPAEGPYLACDDRSWQVRCGIESWFLPQDEAHAMERELADGAYAEVRIDSRGNAAVVDVRESP
jgi:uncharacterized membrane-anchored protein